MTKIKTVLALLAVFALVFGSVGADVCSAYHGRDGKSGHDMEGKVCKKAEMILSNEDELGLSEEQAAKVKELKLKTKKDLVTMKAGIDLVAIDIKDQMWKDPIDVAAINKLIDRKHELKKEKEKNLVAAYAELNGILTAEQKAKMKEIHKKCREKR